MHLTYTLLLGITWKVIHKYPISCDLQFQSARSADLRLAPRMARDERGIRSLRQISLARAKGLSRRSKRCKKIPRQRNNEEPQLRNKLLHDGRSAIRHDLSLRKFVSTLLCSREISKYQDNSHFYF